VGVEKPVHFGLDVLVDVDDVEALLGLKVNRKLARIGSHGSRML
jgi:hypothetical protein